MSKAKSKLVIIDFLVTATSSKLFGPPTFIQPHHSFETSGGSRPQVVCHDPKWSWFHSFQVSSHYWNGTEHQRAWGDWVDESTFFLVLQGRECRCFACNGRIQLWDYGDQAVVRHRRMNPSCPFLLNRSANVPLEQCPHWEPSTSLQVKKKKKKTSFFPLKRRCPKRNRSP